MQCRPRLLIGVNLPKINRPTKIHSFRRAKAADWVTENPTLADGELGLETDTLKIKFGDGSTDWIDQSYATPGTSTVSTSSTDTLTNKRITGRVVTVTAGATPSINTDNGDVFEITGLTVAITSMTSG